jgi:hypothetical protein
MNITGKWIESLITTSTLNSDIPDNIILSHAKYMGRKKDGDGDSGGNNNC